MMERELGKGRRELMVTLEIQHGDTEERIGTEVKGKDEEWVILCLHLLIPNFLLRRSPFLCVSVLDFESQPALDGKTTNGWHTYNKPGTIGRKWKAEEGMLVFEGRNRFEFFVAGRKIELGPVDKALDGGEDIVTDEAFENFELALEWKISEAGNNGIFYTVREDKKYDENWKTSPEMQVQDNTKHKDGLIEKHRAGDLYDLIAADPIRVKPQGEWNKVRIIKNKGKIEHWLNGSKVLSYDINSDVWKDMISKSKFADLPEFGLPGPGRIGFQDHDNRVYYKNIKIKELKLNE